MLHKLNPVRLAYVRDMVDQHWSLDEQGFRPLSGKSALDVGCGAGLLAEPLARLGAQVTAIDAAPEREITFPLGQNKGQMKGGDYLNHFVLPNFYFHLTAAYAVVRNFGVDVGKRDFLGAIPLKRI